MVTRSAKIPFVDEMRGVAILAVFLFHSLGTGFGIERIPWNGLTSNFNDAPRSFLALLPLTFGWAGVPIFFVLSGFCIHLSFVRSENRKFRSFFIRRFFRIYPPYLLCVLILFFLYPRETMKIDPSHGLGDLLTHVLLIHNFDDRFFFGIAPSFWSIAVEVQLYLLYPILLIVATRHGWRKALLVTALFEIGIRAINFIFNLTTNEEMPRWLVSSPFGYWASWSMGAYLAECFIRDKSLPFVRWPPVLILIAAIMSTFFKPTFAFSFPLFSLLTAVVLARFISGLWSIQNYYLTLACRHLSALGVVSYSFYLLHDPILTLVLHVKNYQDQIHPLLIFGICLTLYMPILFMANIVYRFIEMPSIKIGRTLATSIHGADQRGRVAKFGTFVPKPEA